MKSVGVAALYLCALALSAHQAIAQQQATYYCQAAQMQWNAAGRSAGSVRQQYMSDARANAASAGRLGTPCTLGSLPPEPRGNAAAQGSVSGGASSALSPEATLEVLKLGLDLLDLWDRNRAAKKAEEQRIANELAAEKKAIYDALYAVLDGLRLAGVHKEFAEYDQAIELLVRQRERFRALSPYADRYPQIARLNRLVEDELRALEAARAAQQRLAAAARPTEIVPPDAVKAKPATPCPAWATRQFTLIGDNEAPRDVQRFVFVSIEDAEGNNIPTGGTLHIRNVGNDVLYWGFDPPIPTLALEPGRSDRPLIGQYRLGSDKTPTQVRLAIKYCKRS